MNSATSRSRRVAQSDLQRALYIRTQYRFALAWEYFLLEPMDFVTLTDAIWAWAAGADPRDRGGRAGHPLDCRRGVPLRHLDARANPPAQRRRLRSTWRVAALGEPAADLRAGGALTGRRRAGLDRASGGPAASPIPTGAAAWSGPRWTGMRISRSSRSESAAPGLLTAALPAASGYDAADRSPSI